MLPLADDLRHAQFKKGAAAAARLVDRGGQGVAPEQFVKAGDGLLGQGAESGVEGDFATAAGLEVEDGPSGDGNAEHFLQTKGRAEELHVVVVPAAPRPALVLDRIRDGRFSHVVCCRGPACLIVRRRGLLGKGRPDACTTAAEFDHVGNADEIEAVAAEPDVPRQPANGAEFLVAGHGVDPGGRPCLPAYSGSRPRPSPAGAARTAARRTIGRSTHRIG